MRAATHRPIWIKANAGLPELEDGQVVYRTTPQEFSRQVMSVIRAGASFVGGCCGTSPKFIEAIRKQLDG